MTLTCPRCDQPLEHRTVTPSEAAYDVDVHVCPGCRGLWLDREAVAPVCPTVSHLPQRPMEVSLTGRRAGDLRVCPRCGAAPFAVDLLGLTIDVCVQCGGVWLDGDEYEESDLPMGRRKPKRQVEGYRAAPAAGEEPSAKRCAYCGRPIRAGQEYMREHGLACPACHARQEQELARLQEETGLGPFLDRIIKALGG